MITPTKGVRPDRSLLYIAGETLAELETPTTVSGTWDALRRRRAGRGETATVTFDWFVLALDLLYAMRTVEMRDGLITRTVRP